MRRKWPVVSWIGCIAGVALLPGIYLAIVGSYEPLAVLALAGLTLTLGAALAPVMLGGLFWEPISLWTGYSLNLEMCCTQSQGGHAESMFGMMLGAPIAIVIYTIAAQLLFRRSASPGVSLALTAVLFVGWITLFNQADAYAMKELCPPICAKGV